MCAQLAPGVSAAGAASAPNQLGWHRVVDEKRDLEPLGQRASRLVGRGFLGLGVSTWLIGDLTVLFLAICVGYRVFPPPVLEMTPHIALWQAVAVFSFAMTVSALVFGLYERDTLLNRPRILMRMLLTVGVATVLAYGVIYIVMYATVSRRVAGLAMATSFVVGSLVRIGACSAISKVPRGLLVVGGTHLFDSFRRAKRDGLLPGYRLVGHALTDRDEVARTSGRDFLGHVVDQIPNFGPARITDIVVGAPAASDHDLLDWMIPSLQRGCRVTNEATFYEKAVGRILVDEITPAWFLFADLKVHCDRHATVRRLFDLLTAVIGICLSAPLWLLIAIAVKLNDRGHVFYSQERVGQNGQVFTLYKFRTMRPDAENGKSVWASPNDPRVTRVGRFLRRTRFDELPQLFNVLMGHMSIVGPRPERPDIVRELCDVIPYYAERHLVKPGITGWAQISFRYGNTVEDAKQKLQFDLFYLKHMSFELDMTILLRTAGVFLRGAC